MVVLIKNKVPFDAIVDRLDTSDLEYRYGLGCERSFKNFIQDIDWDLCKELDGWAQDVISPVVFNQAQKGVVEGYDIYAKGRFKEVYKCRYANGVRAGHPAVAKFAKNQYVGEDIFWQDDIEAVDKAAGIIDKFNNYLARRLQQSVEVLMSTARVWRMENDNCKHLVEPLINSKFVKFNSNTGREKNDDICKALSHYSYVMTGGQLLLCDLQGGTWWSKDSDGEETQYYILTDPAIHSANGPEFGATDLGQDGIDNFMYHHECGDYCNPGWPKCKTARPVFAPKAGTSLMTSDGRLQGTHYEQYEPELAGIDEGNEDYSYNEDSYDNEDNDYGCYCGSSSSSIP